MLSQCLYCLFKLNVKTYKMLSQLSLYSNKIIYRPIEDHIKLNECHLLIKFLMLPLYVKDTGEEETFKEQARLQEIVHALNKIVICMTSVFFFYLKSLY